MSIGDLVRSGELDRLVKKANDNIKNKKQRHSANISDDILDLIDEIHDSLKYEDLPNVYSRYAEIKAYVEYKLGDNFYIYENQRRNKENEPEF